MSIRMIAKDLYRLQVEVDHLEKQMKVAPSEEQEALKERLRKAKAERVRMKRILEGSKEPSPYRKPR